MFLLSNVQKTSAAVERSLVGCVAVGIGIMYNGESEQQSNIFDWLLAYD